MNKTSFNNTQSKPKTTGSNFLSISLTVLALSLTACSTPNDKVDKISAQNQTPLPTIKEVMTGVIEPASNTLWAAAMDENIPKTDSDWKTLEQAAIQLLTASATISQGGSGVNDNAWAGSDNWAMYNQQMAELSTQILELIRERKYDDMLDAGNLLVEPCGACHTAFPGESQ